MPDTIPDAEPTVPMVGLLLVHVPPGIESVRLIVVPVQTVDGPTITDAVGFTVFVFIEWQPDELV